MTRLLQVGKKITTPLFFNMKLPAPEITFHDGQEPSEDQLSPLRSSQTSILAALVTTATNTVTPFTTTGAVPTVIANPTPGFNIGSSVPPTPSITNGNLLTTSTIVTRSTRDNALLASLGAQQP